MQTALVAIDLNEAGQWEALRPEAVAASQRGAVLHLAHVIPSHDALEPLVQFVPKEVAAAHREEMRRQLSRCRMDVPDETEVHFHLLNGIIYAEVLALADKVAADMIIVRANAPGAESFLLGPNAARIVRHARASVLVVRDAARV